MKADHYMPPQAPGYSVEMKPKSPARYAFPQGAAWQNSGRMTGRS